MVKVMEIPDPGGHGSWGGVPRGLHGRKRGPTLPCPIPHELGKSLCEFSSVCLRGPFATLIYTLSCFIQREYFKKQWTRLDKNSQLINQSKIGGPIWERERVCRTDHTLPMSGLLEFRRKRQSAVYIPRLDKVLQIELTIPTSLGCEFSKLSTEAESFFKESVRRCGFCVSRMAS